MKSVTNLSGARLACVCVGLLFSFSFIGSDQLIAVLTPPLEPSSLPAAKLSLTCAVAALLLGDGGRGRLLPGLAIWSDVCPLTAPRRGVRRAASYRPDVAPDAG